ncbi:MAG: hypothetical protein H7Y00_04820 [Fimbriimonadaceae bacterium]|nr:hypothetical protein [Chitinophagales bacterium]
MEQHLPKHNCKDFTKKVFLVLDGELPETERKLFIEDITRCKGCLDHYHIEKHFKDFVYNRFDRKACSDQLKADIVNEIKKIDAEEG